MTARDPRPDPHPVDTLLDELALEELDRDLYMSTPRMGEGGLFGGLVAAMSVVAVGRTVESDRRLHSLHSYFLRYGRYGVPIRFAVDRIRDGRSFSTRRVVALQGGEEIFSLSASFARPEEGISHQDPMPAAPEPDDLPDFEGLRAKFMADRPFPHSGPVEVRACDPREFEEGARPPDRQVWMRPRGPLPDDPLLHAATLVFATDRTLLSTAALPHGTRPGSFLHASLDHSVWLHRPPRFDDWLLYTSHSPAAHAARGLVHASMHTRDGVRVASVAQEGLVRVPRSA